MHILMLCYSMSKVNKVVLCSVLGKHVFLFILMSMFVMLYVSDMHTYRISKVNKVVPCSVLGKHVFLLILMSMLYVSDTHTHLEAVPQYVKSEQGRSLQCFGKTRVSVNTYVNVCNLIRP